MDWKKYKDYIVIFIVFMVIWLMLRFVTPITRVEGSSMMNTLQNTEMGLTTKINTTPERGDIVIVRSKINKNEQWIKRVIGLPNETISCKDGVVYVNGKVLEEPYLADGMNDTSDFGPVTLESDEYWLMGDNRPISADSRMFGPFRQKDIISKWLFKLPIMSEISRLTTGDQENTTGTTSNH